MEGVGIFHCISHAINFPDNFLLLAHNFSIVLFFYSFFLFNLLYFWLSSEIHTSRLLTVILTIILGHSPCLYSM